MTTRAGAPCLRSNGAPSIVSASIASGSDSWASVSESSYGSSAETNFSAVAAGSGRAAASRSCTRTPDQRTSSTDQPVTQTKSEVCRACGSACNWA